MAKYLQKKKQTIFYTRSLSPPHANSIPSLAKVENEAMPNLDQSTVESCPADTSLLQTSAPAEMHMEMAEINSHFYRLSLLRKCSLPV